MIPHEEKDSLGGSRGGLLPSERGLGGSCTSEFVLICKEKWLRGSQSALGIIPQVIVTGSAPVKEQI